MVEDQDLYRQAVLTLVIQGSLYSYLLGFEVWVITYRVMPDTPQLVLIAVVLALALVRFLARVWPGRSLDPRLRDFGYALKIVGMPDRAVRVLRIGIAIALSVGLIGMVIAFFP